MGTVSGRRGAQRLLASSLEGRGRDLLVWAGWSLLEALPAFLSGRLVALAVDHGFLHHDVLLGLGYLALMGLGVLLSAWATRQAYRRLASIIEPFRDTLARLTVRGALSLRTITAPEADTAVVARLTQQVEFVREAYASLLMVAQGFLITSAGALIGLLTLLPSAAVLVVGPVVGGVILFACVVGPVARAQRSSILADERIAQRAAAMCRGLRDVVACGGEDAARADVEARIAEQARTTVRLARLSGIRALAISVGGLLPIVLILARASWLTRHGASTGVILGALTYVLNGVQPALQTFIGQVGHYGLWLIVTLRRIVEVSEPGSGAEVARRSAPLGEGVRLVDVTYSYGPHADPVIEGFDLTISPGDHLAIVGPSGAGKSTLANVMSGLLAPQRGSVIYGSAAVADPDDPTLAACRVLIPQEAYLFSGTVRENLVYLREDASDADIDKAVKELGAGAVVGRLGGYDAELPVAELSAGERQLMTLVRAYLSPARLVILDEATCHLDPSAEVRAEAAFVRRGGTLVVIAHRISSALRARHVLVLDGREAVLGTHEELVASSPLYRDLVGHWAPLRRGDRGPVSRAALTPALVGSPAPARRWQALVARWWWPLGRAR